MRPFSFSTLLFLTIFGGDVLGQYTPRHTYKVRLYSTQNIPQRGIITAATDSTLTIVWHGSERSYHYSEIRKITIFRKGTVGKWMLATVPLNVAGGLMISDNQSANPISDSFNGIVAFEFGVMAGIGEAATIGSLARKRYAVNGSRDLFKSVLAYIRR